MKTQNGWIVGLAAVVLLGFVGNAAAKPKTCDATAVANAKAAIDAACPCAGASDGNGGTVAWKNHGQYMKCVVHARKDQASQAGVAKQCLKGVVPCAANSTCGKSTAVACVSTTGTCMNDPVPGDTVAEGTCDNSATSCDTDADCSQSTCQIADSADECTAMGGTAASGSCCQ